MGPPKTLKKNNDQGLQNNKIEIVLTHTEMYLVIVNVEILITNLLFKDDWTFYWLRWSAVLICLYFVLHFAV